MNRLVLISLFSLFTLSSFAQKPGAEIKVNIKHYKDSVLYLANYYGNKQYIRDTVKVIKGWATIKEDKAIEPGIYMIVPMDKKSYFDFIIHDEQHFILETDTGDYLKHMKVKGSEQNTLFFQYNTYISKKGKERDSINKLLTNSKTDTALASKLKKKMSDVDKDVEKYKKDYIVTHPKHLLAKLFMIMEDVEMPKELTNDTLKFDYYKAHYFDKTDFSEEGLLRSPLFHNKVMKYFDQLTAQHHDSLIVAVDYVLAKSKANPEIFKYVTHTLTTKYERSQIMCFDAIFVHLINKYYATNQCPWIDEVTLTKMKSRAKALSPTLCGATAKDLTMQGLDGNWYKMSNIKSPYTVLWFWDSDCGHCKAQTPKLKMLTDMHPFKDSVVVFAIDIENETPGFKKYVKENGIGDWINVSDTLHMTRFRDFYDIYSTPVMYLLDKDKKVIAKRLDPDGLYEFLKRKWDYNAEDTTHLDSIHKIEMAKQNPETEKAFQLKLGMMKMKAIASQNEIEAILMLGDRYLEALRQQQEEERKKKENPAPTNNGTKPNGDNKTPESGRPKQH